MSCQRATASSRFLPRVLVISLVVLAGGLVGCGEDTSWTLIVSTSGRLDGHGAVIFFSIDHGRTSGYEPEDLVRCQRFEGEVEFVHQRPGP